MNNTLDLAVVMPAYNEGEVLEEVVQRWDGFLNEHFSDLQTKLIIVNDGSKDNSKEILDQLSESYPRLRAVHQANGGHGNAVVNAYRQALNLGAEWVFQTDSDDQFEPEDVLLLWNKRDQSDLILGYRKVRYDAPIRLVITRIVRLVIGTYFGVRIKDSNIPFRLIKGKYLDELVKRLPDPLPFAPNIFLSVMAYKDGNDLMNIPVRHKDRHTGEVSIKKWKLLKVCYQSYLELSAFRSDLRKQLKAKKSAR